MDCMLVKPIDMKETAVRKLREYFVFKYDKYPEDMIEVEKAIQIFAEVEDNLLKHVEVLTNELLEIRMKEISYGTPIFTNTKRL